MSFRGKRRNSNSAGPAHPGSTHDMRGANGTGKSYKMDGAVSRAQFSRDASRTHKLNTPGGVEAISSSPMRGGIRL
jgi:hypothetical protein